MGKLTDRLEDLNTKKKMIEAYVEKSIDEIVNQKRANIINALQESKLSPQDPEVAKAIAETLKEFKNQKKGLIGRKELEAIDKEISELRSGLYSIKPFS